MRRGWLLVVVPLALVTAYWWDALTQNVTVQAIAADDDVINYFRPLNLLHFHYVELFGELPKWLDRTAFGYPSSSVGQHGVDYLPRLIAMKAAPTAGAAADLLVWLHALVGAAAAFCLARVYRLGHGAAAVAATLYALGHLAIRWAPFFHAPAYFGWAPVALLGLELVWRRRPGAGVPLLGIGLGMAGLGTHLQSTHLLVQVLALVAIFRVLTDEAPRRERLRPLGWSAAGGGLGLLASSPVWLPFALARGESTRVESPIDRIAGMSDGTSRSFFDPTGALDSTTGAINGDLYLGLIAPALVAIGFVLALRRRDTAVLSLLVAVAALVAYKTPALDALVAVVPGWDVVSNVARLSFVAVLPMALLAGVAVDRILALRPAHAAGALAAIVAGSVLLWRAEMSDFGLASAAPLVIGALLLAACLALWLAPGAWRAPLLVAVPVLLAVLTFSGALRERDLGWQPLADVAQPRFQTWLGLVFQTDDPDGRWMSHCQNLQAPGYAYRPITFLESPRGRWIDAYDSFVSESYYGYWRGLTGSRRYDQPVGGQWYQHLPEDPPPDPDYVKAAGISRVLSHESCGVDLASQGWTELGRASGFVSYAVEGAYPHAYLSERWRTVPDRGDALEAVAREGGDFDSHTDQIEAAVDARPGGGDPRQARLVREDAEHLTVDLGTPAERDALLVVLDRQDDDWSAEAGGEELDTFRVNGAFRGVIVPAGTASVEFAYDPWWRPWLPLASTLALVAMLAALALAGWRARRRSDA